MKKDEYERIAKSIQDRGERPASVQFQEMIDSGIIDIDGNVLARYPERPEAPQERPDWDAFFMGLAFLASKRSRDDSMKHGAVAVNSRNRIIGLGYNGFPSRVNDDEMPRTRPDKYYVTPHAEENCLLNCVGEKDGATLYVTGRPCAKCFSLCINAGISRIIAFDGPGYKNPPVGEPEAFELLLKQGIIEYIKIKPDLSWVGQINTLASQPANTLGEGEDVWGFLTSEQPLNRLSTRKQSSIKTALLTAIGWFQSLVLHPISRILTRN